MTANTVNIGGGSGNGGGIFNNGTVTLKNTLISANTPDDCVGC